MASEVGERGTGSGWRDGIGVVGRQVVIGGASLAFLLGFSCYVCYVGPFDYDLDSPRVLSAVPA